MKLNKDALTNNLSLLAEKLSQYSVFIFIVAFLTVYGFLIIRVSSLTQSEPTAAELSAQQETVKRLRVDQESIDKLLDLEEQNIEVQALFQQARDNPFTE